MQIVDKKATTWFVNIGAYRMNDPSTGHNFEPGIKYRIEQSEWMAGQPTIKETDMEEEVEHLEPKKPRGPRVDRSEGFTPSEPKKS